MSIENMKKGEIIVDESTGDAYRLDKSPIKNSHGCDKEPNVWEYTTWSVPVTREATDELPEKKFFMKLTRKDASNMVRALEAESRFKIRFPYIEYIQGIFETEIDGMDYCVLVVEFFDSMTLAKYMSSTRLTAGRSLKEIEIQQFIYMLQLLYAVDAYSSYYEKDPMTHRDLKPDNIMIVEKESRLVLVDFDWAHIPGFDTYFDRKEKGRAVCGTRGYADPRNFKVTHSDIQMDIYALAMLFYFMLTGEHYFKTRQELDEYRTDCELAYEFNMNKVPLKSVLRQQEYAPLLEIIRKAMAPVEKRYTNVKSMIIDLEKFLRSRYPDEEQYQEQFYFKELLDVPLILGKSDGCELRYRYMEITDYGYTGRMLYNHQSARIEQNGKTALLVYNRNGKLACYPITCESLQPADENGEYVVTDENPGKFSVDGKVFDVYVCSMQ